MDKYVWRATEVEFLGYVLSRDGIKIAHNKVEAVLSWKTPDSLTEVQAFPGFANFYRQFIQDYSLIARPLMELIKKTEKWASSNEAGAAFEELKQRFTMAPIVAHFDVQKFMVIGTDASDFAIGAVLSQRDD